MYFQTRPSIPDDQQDFGDILTTMGNDPDALAYTGSNTLLLCFAAAVLITLGAAMIQSSRNPRQYPGR